MVHGVVHVGQTQAVAELMAGCAYSGKHIFTNFSIAPQLTATGIGVNDGIVEFEIDAPSFQMGLVGPEVVRTCSFSLAIACKNNKHLIDLTITVPIIVGIVDVVVSMLNGFLYQLSGALVIIILYGFAIISQLLGGCIGSHHVEVKLKLSVALGLEVVLDRSCHPKVRIAFLIEVVIKYFVGIVIGELEVLELHQNHQTFL